ncbi:MAG: hypothetical protein ACJAT4_000788, partial [Granulosicoccus sp.]
MSTTKLSKTNYLSYLACPEECWMQYHQPELMPAFSLDAQHQVEQGKIIDRLAQEWFREGSVIFDQAIDPAQVSFQYRVEQENNLAIADVVVFHGDKKCDIYEVKASTKLKDEHLNDLAFQRMVFEAAGYEVSATYLINVNNKYPFQRPTDLSQFLKVKNVTTVILEILEDTVAATKAAWEWMNLPALSDHYELPVSVNSTVPISKKNNQGLPTYTIFDITRLHAAKSTALLAQGILDIQDVPVDFDLSARQRQQVNVAQKNEIQIDSPAIQNILQGLRYPLYFLDYETFAYVEPPQERLVAYQQMVFQYSLHVIESPGSEVQHFEYLMSTKASPMEALIQDLAKHLKPTEGTVLVWSEGFEKARNREMGKLFPKYASFLDSVNERVYDLMKVFREGHYQHPKFKGKTSIKKVLPILCPELSYQDLEIQNGGAAVIQWHHMTDGRMTEDQAKQTFQDLLKYCKLDTWAMVRIW